MITSPSSCQWVLSWTAVDTVTKRQKAYSSNQVDANCGGDGPDVNSSNESPALGWREAVDSRAMRSFGAGPGPAWVRATTSTKENRIGCENVFMTKLIS